MLAASGSSHNAFDVESQSVCLNEMARQSGLPRKIVGFLCLAGLASLAFTVDGIFKHGSVAVQPRRLAESSSNSPPASMPTLTPCRDAVLGEECYHAVELAMDYGIEHHPSWYVGLNSSSTFQDIQAYLHQKGYGQCEMPCPLTSAPTPSPTPKPTPAPTVPCHDAAPGEECYHAVELAIAHGIEHYPSWYAGLNSSSTFHDVQAHLFEKGYASCEMPCQTPMVSPAPEPSPSLTAEPTPAPKDAATPTSSVAPTYAPTFHPTQSPTPAPTVAPTVTPTAVPTPALTNAATMAPTSSPTPSPTLAPTVAPSATPTSAPTPACHDAVAGEECYRAIDWAMKQGISQHPSWYPGLTSSSSFHDFQVHLHEHGHSHCEMPCPVTAAPTQMPTPSPPTVSPTPSPTVSPTVEPECHTAVKGEKCYQDVQWAMQYGINEHPSWYPGLSRNSRFEEFQQHFHEKGLGDCQKPCPHECLCIFDIDRTLTGKQSDEQCPANEQFHNVWDNA